MSETTFTRFAVIGAGTVGKRIADIIASKPELSLVVITRSTNTSSTSTNYTTASIPDYSDVSAVTALFKKHGTQAVISTVAEEAILLQIHLADAAKAAGVQIFIPSEFGFNGIGITTGFLGEKNAVVDHLTSIDLPYIRFYTGGFIEWIPWLLDIDDSAQPKEAHVVGSGNVPASFNSVDDITAFVVHLLTTFPSSKLVNHKMIRLQAVRATLVELADLLHAKVVFLGEIPGENGPRKTKLHEHVENGLASIVWDLPEEEHEKALGNGLWGGYQWKGVKDIHG